MGKDKLRRFAENLTFECFVQPAFEEAFRRDHPLKGHWHSDFFHNDRPIVLELGCGKAEKTRLLAETGRVGGILALEVDTIQHERNLQIADLPQVQFRHAGAEAIPADDNSIDIVLMFKSLHHVPMEFMDQALSEIARVLKPTDMITLEYRSERLNLNADDKGVVTRVNCG